MTDLTALFAAERADDTRLVHEVGPYGYESVVSAIPDPDREVPVDDDGYEVDI